MARYLGVKANNTTPYYFVSYNSEDQNRVADYIKVMCEYGINIWYDDGIEQGEKWEAQIAKNIQGCEGLFMFISKALFKKEDSYVKTEHKIAKNNYKKKIHVICLDEIKAEDIPHTYAIWWAKLDDTQNIYAYQYDTPRDCVKTLFDKISLAASDITTPPVVKKMMSPFNMN